MTREEAPAGLPLISIDGLFSERLADRQAVADQLRQACEERGFFYILDHRVPAALIEVVFAQSGRLFALPWQGKNVYVYSPEDGTTTVVPVTPEAPGRGDWAGGVLAPNGKIYGIPARAERVLEIDTKAVGTLPLEVLLNGFTNRY